MPTVYFITGSQNTVATSLMKGLLQLRFPEMTLLLQTASEREAVYEMKARCEQSDVVMLVGTPDPIDQFCLGVAESMSCKLLCAGLPADQDIPGTLADSGHSYPGRPRRRRRDHPAA